MTLSVEVTGTSPVYQWQKGGLDIPGATASTYSFDAFSTDQSGTYQVIVTNARSRLMPEPVVVEVVPDRTGPFIRSAVIHQFIPNGIELSMSEVILRSSVLPGNFRLIRISDGAAVIISNTVSSGSQVLLRTGVPAEQLLDDYKLIVNGVSDVRGNRIAPDTTVPVQWPIWRNIIFKEQEWLYHATAVFDPTVYDEPWTSLHYEPGPWWANDRGVFFHGPGAEDLCGNGTMTEIGFQMEPTLFRTTFNWPDGIPTTAVFRFRMGIDDGAVFFVNEREIMRVNAGSGPVDIGSRAASAIAQSVCQTNLSAEVTNLVAGTNVFAVALLQSAGGVLFDTAFALEATARYLRVPLLPEESSPTLSVRFIATNLLELNWRGGGYALERSPTLNAQGPWTEATNQSNPYQVQPSENFEAFRLRRK